jgi:hypothetical protein
MSAGSVIHDVVEPILDLRHAQDADDGDHDQQHKHEGKAQAQTHADLHVC